jgi:hypothetical protein
MVRYYSPLHCLITWCPLDIDLMRECRFER